MKSIFASLVFISSFIVTPLYAEDKIGVVLMHGKWGTSLPSSPVGKLAAFLSENGILVSAPDMPWSRSRGMDKPYEESMDEIDEIVRELRGRGATKIVVGGHSIGANAAIGYGARREGLAGVLAIAPGHTPERERTQEKTDYDWQRAKAMVDAGKAEEVSGFKDLNQGNAVEKEIQASIYLSWYGPEGPAAMPKNVAYLKPGTPLLWIIGERDRMYDRGEKYAYRRAPSHPRNAYIVVKGGHKATPKKGKREILDWLESL